MKCRADRATLVMTERTGVEIDCCPTCRGAWLDRGELDKILKRSAAGPPVRDDYYCDERGHGRRSRGARDRRRGGRLSEFD